MRDLADVTLFDAPPDASARGPQSPAPEPAEPKRPTAAKRRPASLMAQLGLLVAIAVVISSAMAATLALSHFKRHVLSSIEDQVSAIARSAALGGRGALGTGDYHTLQRVLGDLLQVPGIEAISMHGPDGQTLVAVERRQGEVRGTATNPTVRFDLPAVQLPATRQAVVKSTWDGEPGFSSAWVPVDAEGVAGWVNVRADLGDAAQAVQQALIEVCVWVGTTCLLCFALLYLFLRRSLLPLAQIARFAARMKPGSGAQVQVNPRSREVAKLAESLNQMATNLKNQYQIIEHHDAEMSAVLDTTADAIIGLDEFGRVTLANASTSSLFGWNRASAIGNTVDSILPGLNRDRIDSLLAEAVYTGGRGTRTARFDFKGLRNGGTSFPVEVCLSEISGDGNSRYALFVRDITEKLAAEESLRLFRRAVDASSHGVVISSMTYPKEPIVYVNRAFEEMTGFPLSEVIGRQCKILQGAETDQPAVHQLRQAISERREAKVQLRNFRRDGEMFWNELSIAPVFDQEGELTHFVGIQTDITARVLAQEAVNRRGEQLDTILNLSPDGFVMFDAERFVAYANPAFCSMVGLSASSLVGEITFRQFEQLLQDRCDPSMPYPDILMDTGMVDILHLMLPQRRILERVIRTSRSGNGELILCYRDITRESEIDRMKSEFLSTAAHELRTPMVSIFGFAELMLHRSFPPERSRMMLETIHRQSGLIVNLVNELLDLARIEARSGKDFNIGVKPLKPIVTETLAAILIPNDDRQVEVQWDGDDDLLVAVDDEKLGQALRNVVSNAFKYSPRGGSIQLRLTTDQAPEGMIGIQVTDQGIGMSPEQLERVFERFYRADPSGNIPGTGLGLCLVKEIVELQGGRVAIASQAGVGTQVTIWLPLRTAVRLAA